MTQDEAGAIHRRLDKLFDEMSAIKQGIARRDGTCTQHGASLLAHELLLVGTDKRSGLVGDVRTLIAGVKRIMWIIMVIATASPLLWGLIDRIWKR